jgi:HK97 family phage prohead protease
MEPDNTFKIHTGKLKAYSLTGDDGVTRYFLEGTASSTIEDRHGDSILSSAQFQMLEAARNLTMWLNHSYVVPEDILGTCKESTLEAAGDLLDLKIKLEVYPDNPRAMASYKAVDKGIKLGFSIGGKVLDFEWKDTEDIWSLAMDIISIDLFEISLVGIPANPRAYVEEMAKSVRKGVKDADPVLLTKSKQNDKIARAALKAALLGAPAPEANMDPKNIADTSETPTTEPAATTEPVAETPDATALAAELTTVKSALDTEKANVTTAKTEAANAQAAATKAADELTAVRAELDAEKAAHTETKNALETLRATPTGRKSIAAGVGGSGTGTVGYNLNASARETQIALAAKMQGQPADARSRAAG